MSKKRLFLIICIALLLLIIVLISGKNRPGDDPAPETISEAPQPQEPVQAEERSVVKTVVYNNEIDWEPFYFSNYYESLDGKPCVVGVDKVICASDNRVVTELPAEMITTGDITETQSFLCGGAFDKAGRTAALFTDVDENGGFVSARFSVFSKDGILSEDAVLTGLPSEDLHFSNARIAVKQVGFDESFFMYSVREDRGTALLVFDRTGAFAGKYDRVSFFKTLGEGKVLTTDGSRLSVLDLDTGDERTVMTSSKVITEFWIDGNSVYALMSDGIYEYNIESGELAGCTLLFTDAFAGDIPVLSSFAVYNDEVYLSVLDPSGSSLQEYRIAKEVSTPVTVTDTITVYSPYRDPVIENAVLAFSSVQPQIKVEYNYDSISKNAFYSEGTLSPYWDKRNLKLISGNAGDVIIISNDSDRYKLELLNSDIFTDLSDVISDDVLNELDPVITAAAESSGKMHGIPVYTNYYYMYANNDLLSKYGLSPDFETMTWSDCLKLYEKVREQDQAQYFFAGNNPERLFARAIISNLPDLIDAESGEIKVNEDWFMQLLEAWRTASADPYFFLADPSGVRNTYDKALFWIDGMSMDSDVGNLYDEAYGNAAGLDAEMTAVPLPGGELHPNRTCGSYCTAAISANSENPDASRLFVEYLLSENVQNNTLMNGIAVNLKSRSKQTEYSSFMRKSDPAIKDKVTEELSNIFENTDYLFDMEKYKNAVHDPVYRRYINGNDDLNEVLKDVETSIRMLVSE